MSSISTPSTGLAASSSSATEIGERSSFSQTKIKIDKFIQDVTDMTDETPEQAKFRASLIVIAAQARRFGPSRATELLVYLQSARVIAHELRDLEPASNLQQRALSLLKSYINSTNRLRYLLGVFVGFFATTIIFCLLRAASGLAGNELPLPSPNELAPLFAFCGMGTFVSVVTRLREMDLSDEPSAWLLVISGAARPIVAIFMASVVYVILKNDYIPVHLGPAGTAAANQYQQPVGWIAAFLSGFSERFATDFISSLPFANTQRNAANAKTATST